MLNDHGPDDDGLSDDKPRDIETSDVNGNYAVLETRSVSVLCELWRSCIQLR